MCTLLCTLKFDINLKETPHTSHICGLKSGWSTVMCDFKLDLVKKLFSQHGQVIFISKCSFSICCVTNTGVIKVSSQNRHDLTLCLFLCFRMLFRFTILPQWLHACCLEVWDWFMSIIKGDNFGNNSQHSTDVGGALSTCLISDNSWYSILTSSIVLLLTCKSEVTWFLICRSCIQLSVFAILKVKCVLLVKQLSYLISL